MKSGTLLWAVLLLALLTILAPPSVRADEDLLLEAALEKAAGVSPPRVGTALLLRVAETYVQFGEPERALHAFQLAAEHASNSSAASHSVEKVAAACAEAGFTEQALQVAAQVEGERRISCLLQAAEAAAEAGRKQAGRTVIGELTDRIGEIADPWNRADRLIEAAAVFAKLGETSEASRNLERAANAVQDLKPPRVRDRVLGRIAVERAEMGRFEAAREALRRMDDPSTKMKALLETSALAAAAGRREDARELRRLAMSQAEELPVEDNLRIIGEAVSTYAEAEEHESAQALVEEVESLARKAKPREARDRHLARAASLYAEIGLLEDAARVAAETGSDYQEARFRVQAVVQNVRQGDTAGAAALLHSMRPGHIRYAGYRNMKELASVWRHIHPEATIERLRLRYPRELADAYVTVLHTEAFQAGRYKEALKLARRITRPTARSEAFEKIALSALHDPDWEFEQAVELAREVLDATSAGSIRLHLVLAMATEQAARGNTTELQDAISELRRLARQGAWDEAEAEGLSGVAVLQHRLGRTNEALETIEQAVDAAEKIGCGSCRIVAAEFIFTQLYRLGNWQMLRTALAALDPPDLVREHALEALQQHEGLEGDQQRFLLRSALEAALETHSNVRQVKHLVALASAYRETGLSPAVEEREMLLTPHETHSPLEERMEQLKSSLAAEAERPPAGSHLAFFSQPGCAQCEEVKELLDKVLADYPATSVRTYNIQEEEAAVINKATCRGLGLSKSQHLVTPAVLAANGGLVSGEISEESLLALISRARGMPPARIYHQKWKDWARQELASDYESLGLLVVVPGGLLDGLNPCAFTVIIFFLSYMAYVGKSKKQIAWAGGIFTAAVFVTYLGAGLALIQLVEFAEGISVVFTKALYGVTAALVFVAAILSFRDGLLCLRGRTRDLTLTLPDKLQSKIRQTIAKRTRLGLTIGATAVLGAAVALFELPCTGQTYLPVIVFALNHLEGHFWGPVGWLLLYNLCFILPLIVVFVGVFYGLTSEKLTAWFRRHMAATKFGLAAFFAGLFAFMLTQIF